MKHNGHSSTIPFIFALLVHAVIILLFILLDTFKPVISHPLKEERFRLSLKENKTALHESLSKNDQPKISAKPPVPHGEQLIKPIPVLPQPSKPVSTPPPTNIAQPPLETPKKAYEFHVAKPVATIERQPLPPKKEPTLYDIFSRSDNVPQEKPKTSLLIVDSVHELYGEKFNELSPGEQKYILDNTEIMRRITQKVLNNLAPTMIPSYVQVRESNLVEFYIHPDGHISDFRFIKRGSLSVLDETTQKTIECSFGQYPHPLQKTLLRYKVTFY